MNFLVKMTFAEQKAFLKGIIYALDHRIAIDTEKDFTFEFERVEGKISTMTVVRFKWIDCYEIESEEPIFADDSLWLDGTETPEKIVRDIDDILERINDAEIAYKSRVELLADAYFEG